MKRKASSLVDKIDDDEEEGNEQVVGEEDNDNVWDDDENEIDDEFDDLNSEDLEDDDDVEAEEDGEVGTTKGGDRATKTKKNKNGGGGGGAGGESAVPGSAFAAAFSQILASSTRTVEVPILRNVPAVEKRLKEEKLEVLKQKRLRLERRLIVQRGRVKEPELASQKERELRKLATRGVVQLFNAVSKHQGDKETMSAVAEPTAKRSKISHVEELSKSNFLSLLKSEAEAARASSSSGLMPSLGSAAGGTRALSGTPSSSSSSASSGKTSKWSVLRDDLLMTKGGDDDDDENSDDGDGNDIAERGRQGERIMGDTDDDGE